MEQLPTPQGFEPTAPAGQREVSYVKPLPQFPDLEQYHIPACPIWQLQEKFPAVAGRDLHDPQPEGLPGTWVHTLFAPHELELLLSQLHPGVGLGVS